jgi:hypothetical protein
MNNDIPDYSRNLKSINERKFRNDIINLYVFLFNLSLTDLDIWFSELWQNNRFSSISQKYWLNLLEKWAKSYKYLSPSFLYCHNSLIYASHVLIYLWKLSLVFVLWNKEQGLHNSVYVHAHNSVFEECNLSLAIK